MTTTATDVKKKKLVYKQDPDGIYRLKKIGEDDKLSTKSDKRTPEEINNDLIGMNFKVIDPNISTVPEEPEEIERAPSPVSEKTQIQPAPKLAQIKTSYSPPRTGVSQEVSPVHRAMAKSPSPMTTPALESGSSPVLYEADEPQGLPKFLDLSSPIIHIPSFWLGLLLAFLLTRFSTHILHYTKVFLDYAKVGVLWGIILGVIGWYSGVVKLESFPQLQTVVNRLLNRPSPEPVEVQVEVREPEALRSSPVPEPVQEHNYFPPDTQVKDYYQNPALQKHKQRRHRPRAESRRSTQSVPRRPPLNVPDKYSSVPNLTAFRSSVEPQLNRLNSDKIYNRFVEESMKNHSKGSISSMDTLDSNSRHHSPVAEVLNSPLPALPEGDLPLINNIKIGGSHFDELGHQLAAIPAESLLHRLNTGASKNSVLGTRAKYNNFVGNAAHFDND